MTTVVLCGSARFETQFKEASKQLGLMGLVVIGLSSYPSENEGNKNWYQPDEKEMLDLVHLEKIRLADAVLVLDGVPTFASDSSHDPYIGFSTAREILWAQMQERPCFSLLSASGWGNIAECLTNRFDETFHAGHTWLHDHARHVLRLNNGVNVVQEQVHQGERDIMHAGLSVIACQAHGPVDMYATEVLRLAGLDPLDTVPPLVPRFPKPASDLPFGVQPDPVGYGNADGFVGTREDLPVATEEMATLERRRLVGTVIMIYALAKIAGKRGSRRDVADKLAMMMDTLLESYKVSMQEVLGSLADPDDLPNAIDIGCSKTI